MALTSWCAACSFLLLAGVPAASSRANVVFVLTDDQDATLASMNVMNATRALIGAQGAFCRFWYFYFYLFYLKSVFPLDLFSITLYALILSLSSMHGEFGH